jgi:hypothetical protein
MGGFLDEQEKNAMLFIKEITKGKGNKGFNPSSELTIENL